MDSYFVPQFVLCTGIGYLLTTTISLLQPEETEATWQWRNPRSKHGPVMLLKLPFGYDFPQNFANYALQNDFVINFLACFFVNTIRI